MLVQWLNWIEREHTRGLALLGPGRSRQMHNVTPIRRLGRLMLEISNA